MKKLGFVLFCLVVVGCSDSPTNIKDGWTLEQVKSTRTQCVTDLRSGPNPDTEEVANKYCQCVVDKASVLLTYSDYSQPKDKETQDVIAKINTDCDAAL